MQKEPLFRKENRTARGMRHSGGGGEFRHKRNTQKEVQSEATRTSMSGKRQRGLDYTPLFMFLLSKVGSDWNSVHREAVSRLDKPEPIFWLVALHDHEKKDFVRMGEASYFSGLYVNEQGLLAIVNPDLGPEKMAPLCRCCTHTFNGKPFGRPVTDASFSTGDPLS
jgi:hypothetical protein